MKNKEIGITKRKLKAGEIIGSYIILGPQAGKLICKDIKFFPWGKKKLIKHLLGG